MFNHKSGCLEDHDDKLFVGKNDFCGKTIIAYQLKQC